MAHRFLGHRLAEGNRRGFENAIAEVALGRRKITDQQFDDLVGIVSLAALKTDDFAVAAVELDNFFIRQTCLTVQSVDVLRDQSDEFSLDVQRVNKIMTDIRSGVLVLLPSIQAPLPRFDARRLAAHIFLKRDRPVTRPDAAGTAKVRDAGFGADPRAGEHDDFIVLADFLCEVIHGHHGSFYRTALTANTTSALLCVFDRLRKPQQQRQHAADSDQRAGNGESCRKGSGVARGADEGWNRAAADQKTERDRKRHG